MSRFCLVSQYLNILVRVPLFWNRDTILNDLLI